MRWFPNRFVSRGQTKRVPSLLAFRIQSRGYVKILVDAVNYCEGVFAIFKFSDQLLEEYDLEATVIVVVFGEVSWTLLTLELNVFCGKVLGFNEIACCEI